MLNYKYLANTFLYFFSVNNLEYPFIIGFYYLVQDYFLFLFSNFRDFSYLSTIVKENLKFSLFILIFICCFI
jgi:hypothetical protein